MNLTRHQSSVLKNLLNSNSKIVQLTGAGGVGKSHTIGEFISTLPANSFALCGTTHRAVRNVSDMCEDIEGKTIHSFLGFNLSPDDDGGYGLKKKKTFQPQSVDYLIIDESSMMTRQLMTEVELFVKRGLVRQKVILVGDEIQLQIDKFMNLNKYPKFELQEQMRQKGTNTLTHTLSKLRDEIDTNGKPFEISEELGVLEMYDNHKEFLRAYKESKHQKVIIAYTNQTVSAYNRNIKKYVHNHDDIYNEGDLVYPMSPVINHGEIVIKNREVVQIATVNTYDDFHVLFTTDGDFIKVPTTKTWLNNLLQPLADAKDWRAYYKTKEEYNFVHHTFAGTCHSLQGSSVDEVWIDYSDFNPPDDKLGLEQMRLFYVALSRAKIKANIFYGSVRDYKGLK